MEVRSESTSKHLHNFQSKSEPDLLKNQRLSTVELSANLGEVLQQLANKIGTYQWLTEPRLTEPHRSGWPTELSVMEVLKFECKRIDSAVAQLDTIPQIHQKLLDHNRV